MIQRRNFLMSGLGALAASATLRASSFEPATMREFLSQYVVAPETLERFLDPSARVWARFHPTYGYLLRNSFVRDGQDGASTLARYEESGQRQQINFADQPCRLHTYGDSFTQGHQVSDGETWQEILAAHFCEPIRNFGVGGFGVYQAARRLMDIESTPQGAEYLVFNIWGDDHFRSIYPWRWLSFPPQVLASMSDVMFHANPWVHARLDVETGQLIDRPNLCPDEANLRHLGDLDWIEETFGSDPVVQLLFARSTGKIVERETIDVLSRLLGIHDLKLQDASEVRSSAQRLLHRYGVRVGIETMRRVHQFTKERGKKLLVLLSYPVGSVWHACNRTPSFNDSDHVDWHPQEFRDALQEWGVPCVDSLPAHVAEFDTFRLTAKDYVDRYYIGHYTPRGNHFFAYAIKDALRDWLQPAPPAYRTDEERLIRFEGYLPG